MEKVDVQIVDILLEDSGNIRVVEDTFEFRMGLEVLLNQERGINMVHRIIFAEDLLVGGGTWAASLSSATVDLRRD